MRYRQYRRYSSPEVDAPYLEQFRVVPLRTSPVDCVPVCWDGVKVGACPVEASRSKDRLRRRKRRSSRIAGSAFHRGSDIAARSPTRGRSCVALQAIDARPTSRSMRVFGGEFPFLGWGLSGIATVRAIGWNDIGRNGIVGRWVVCGR